MDADAVAQSVVAGQEAAQSAIDAGMWQMVGGLCRPAGLVDKLKVVKAKLQLRIKEIDRMLELCAADPAFVERYDLLAKIHKTISAE